MTSLSHATSPPFRLIGKGFCGSVWAADREGPSYALKREDGSTYRSLSNDFEMHGRVIKGLEAVKSSEPQIQIPQPYALISANDKEWWAQRLSRFPSTYTACQVLISERIPPFPTLARQAILDRFCPLPAKKLVEGTRNDEDCLIRPYLGCRRQTSTKLKRFFTLRNVAFHVDQMEEMGLDTTAYAILMADALATMHWSAKVDANDVEFVLAPRRLDHNNPPLFNSPELGEHTMWILDFDCCQPLSMDETGIQQAVRCFYRNDRYYPRPCSEVTEDQRLWTVFRKRFIETSAKILGENELSIRFVQAIEQAGVALKAGTKTVNDFLFDTHR
jgi:Zinc finger protein